MKEDSATPTDSEQSDNSDSDDEHQDDSEGESERSGKDRKVELSREPEAVMHIRASVRHLKLACSYFERSLDKKWRKSAPGPVIAIEGWCPDSFYLVMAIIHGSTYKVPRELSLEKLAKLAVVVDFYVRNWASGMEREKMYKLYSRDLMMWMLTCSVFSKSDELRSAVRAAIRRTKGPLDTLGLPIPALLVDFIDNYRTDIISKILAFFETQVAQLQRKEIQCTPA